MIHKYTMSGYNIVLDVESGGVFVIDDLAFKMLDDLGAPMQKKCPNELFEKFPDYSQEDVKKSYDEIYSLYSSNRLFSDGDITADKYERLTENSPVKAMCLNVAHDCNLRCGYCFASTGDFGGARKLMPLEVAKKAIDFLVENSGKRRNLEVDFFGGEPLLNFDVVKKTVEYAKNREKIYNKNFRFTITTNGVLLDDEKIEYINHHMNNVVLSLDGRREVNDRIRRRVDGSGSYDLILPKFLKLVEGRKDKDYYVRGTFTKYNLDFVKDVLHINDCGFDQISVEPVVCDSSCEYAITEEDLPKIFEQYELLANEIVEKKKAGQKINFFHFMIDLNQGPCLIKRLKGCGCGNEYVAVSPDGWIYPCHQFVGVEKWKMGNVAENKLDQKMKKDFSKTTIFHKEECKNCWAKFFCSGGCNANNHQYAGNILKPHKISCEMEKKRIECAIMIKAALG